MKRALLTLVSALALFGANVAGAAEPPERIVFLRHGEKPPKGLGQLDCRGLNRALALPAYLNKAFGRPDAIFAPDPGRSKKDSGETYDYVRPLVTIEPTAIALGMPVDAHIGFDDLKGLEAALRAPELSHALVFVAWEHKIIDVVVRDLLAAQGGNPADVPTWDDKDFDGVDIVTIADGKATFSREKEGLDGEPEACPR